MQALFWILFCVAVYFILRLLDHEEKKIEAVSNDILEGSKIEPVTCHLQYFCVKDKGYHVSVWPNVDGYANIDYIEFDIAGITYHADTAMKHLGENIGYLLQEPDNPHDANAIRIMTSDWQLLGYTPRDMTATIREQITLPCRCYYYIGHYIHGDKIEFYTDAYIDLTKPQTDIIN